MSRPTLSPAGPLTGTEGIPVIQGGRLRMSDTKSISALSPGKDGAPGYVYIASVDVTEKVAVALTLPTLRTLDVAVAGVLATDRLAVYPTALPTGYAVHNAVPLSVGRVRVTLTVPALVALTTYTIPCAFYAVGRS